MVQNDSKVRREWIERQHQHGNAPRAVLMKGLHPLINETIDKWHRSVLQEAFRNFQTGFSNSPSLDIGCGYGRLAGTAEECGLAPIAGIDFTEKFCSDFPRSKGFAVCGDLSDLPFADSSFKSAYSVTALMYLPSEIVRKALMEIDRCLHDNSFVLILEPSLEFNKLVRYLLRGKRSDALARPGFSYSEWFTKLAPESWLPIASGGCTWLTAVLPLLIASTTIPAIYRYISDSVLRWDKPGSKMKLKTTRFSMYRWILYCNKK